MTSLNKLATKRENTSVIFLHVSNTQMKLQHLIQVVEEHYAKRERLLILVETEAAAKYIDQFLWTSPPASFIIHDWSESESQAPVLITQTIKNLNSAIILFNLCSISAPIVGDFHVVYDLDDHTSEERAHLSQKRHKCYVEKGFMIGQR